MGFGGIPGAIWGSQEYLTPPLPISLPPPPQRVLLPQGYPESVSPDYLQYQCWDALQVLLGALGGGWGPLGGHWGPTGGVLGALGASGRSSGSTGRDLEVLGGG